MYNTVKKKEDILNATTQAGRELVETHRVSPETLARIQQPLTNNVYEFAKIANCVWKTCITEGVTLKKFANENMRPRPDSIEAFLILMPIGFNPEVAGDTKATLQFEFTGSAKGSCYFIIEDETIKAKKGKSERPDLIIKTPFDVWMDIVTGKADGAEMFMAGKYEVEGNTEFLDMNKFFGK